MLPKLAPIERSWRKILRAPAVLWAPKSAVGSSRAEDDCSQEREKMGSADAWSGVLFVRGGFFAHPVK